MTARHVAGEVVLRPGGKPYRARRGPVAELFMSCPGGHPEGVLVCGRHRDLARNGGLDCFTCSPPVTAFIVVEVPL